MIKGIQLVGILVSLYLFYQSYRFVKQKKEDVKQFFFWILVGVLLFISSIFPEMTDFFLDFLGLRNRTFAIIILGVLLLYLLFFNYTSRIDRLDREISQINEKLSVLEYQLKTRKK